MSESTFLRELAARAAGISPPVPLLDPPADPFVRSRVGAAADPFTAEEQTPPIWPAIDGARSAREPDQRREAAAERRPQPRPITIRPPMMGDTAWGSGPGPRPDPVGPPSPPVTERTRVSDRPGFAERIVRGRADEPDQPPPASISVPGTAVRWLIERERWLAPPLTNTPTASPVADAIAPDTLVPSPRRLSLPEAEPAVASLPSPADSTPSEGAHPQWLAPPAESPSSPLPARAAPALSIGTLVVEVAPSPAPAVSPPPAPRHRASPAPASPPSRSPLRFGLGQM